jgi:hypothetical protein
MAMGMLYVVYRADTVRVASDPWRLLVLLPWAPYVALGDVITCSCRLRPSACAMLSSSSPVLAAVL